MLSEVLNDLEIIKVLGVTDSIDICIVTFFLLPSLLPLSFPSSCIPFFFPSFFLSLLLGHLFLLPSFLFLSFLPSSLLPSLPSFPAHFLRTYLGTLTEWMSKAVVRKCGLFTATGSIAGNLLGKQVLQPYPRPPESETLGLEPSSLCFSQPARWSWIWICWCEVLSHANESLPPVKVKRERPWLTLPLGSMTGRGNPVRITRKAWSWAAQSVGGVPSTQDVNEMEKQHSYQLLCNYLVTLR